MQVLYVHGMGRTPASGWLILRQLRLAGLQTTTFAYSVSRESFAQITARLAARVGAMLEEEELVLIGHSLGGVLLREAVSLLSPLSRQPSHLFLLGSPVQPSYWARRLSKYTLFRIVTKDCGELLGSRTRMLAISQPNVRTTGIAGTRGISGWLGPFGTEPNDGVVSLAEVSAEWLEDQVCVAVVHTLLPSSRRVAAVILQRLMHNKPHPR
jgi:pimeloyl-ACP methyl ester carboxylesterase